MTEGANLFPDLRRASTSREEAAECSPGRKPGVRIHSGFRAQWGRQTLMIVIDSGLQISNIQMIRDSVALFAG
jgi:hypothetical protein